MSSDTIGEPASVTSRATDQSGSHVMIRSKNGIKQHRCRRTSVTDAMQTHCYAAATHLVAVDDNHRAGVDDQTQLVPNTWHEEG